MRSVWETNLLHTSYDSYEGYIQQLYCMIPFVLFSNLQAEPPDSDSSSESLSAAQVHQLDIFSLFPPLPHLVLAF